MRAGKLDRRVTFQRASRVDDGFTNVASEWTDLAETWAQVTPISDGERWLAGEIGANVTHRFVVRWQTNLIDLNPKDRIAYDGRFYDISATKEIGRRQGIEVTASARAD